MSAHPHPPAWEFQCNNPTELNVGNSIADSRRRPRDNSTHEAQSNITIAMAMGSTDGVRKAFDESMRSGGDGAVEEAVKQAVEQALASIEEPGSVQLPHRFVGVRVRQ